MALHNFIRESKIVDPDFNMCDLDENYVPFPESSSPQQRQANTHLGDEDQSMNVFRDNIADALIARREQ